MAYNSVAKDMLLMFADIPVMRINFDTGVYDILDEKRMPYGLRGRILKIPDETEVKQISDALGIANHNAKVINKWLGYRVLMLSRANAKKIYNALGFSQVESEEYRAEIAVICRAVSVLDQYWLKLDGDKSVWKDMDLRHNSLNEVVAQIALHGTSLTFQGSYNTPELTTNGAYAKAWRRHKDGNIWLYKLGYKTDLESRIEVSVSNILDKCNVDHVHYEAGVDGGKYVCMCPCITSDKYSIITSMEYNSYCGALDIDKYREPIRIDPENYYKMHIVDYLISNSDRHDQNWGYFIDNDTCEVVKLHPLFDHNNAFDEEFMKDKNFRYIVTMRSARESALYAMKKVDFHFIDNINRKDFVATEHYRSFMDRAEDLGIKSIKKTTRSFFDAIKIMGGK